MGSRYWWEYSLVGAGIVALSLVGGIVWDRSNCWNGGKYGGSVMVIVVGAAFVGSSHFDGSIKLKYSVNAFSGHLAMTAVRGAVIICSKSWIDSDIVFIYYLCSQRIVA